MNGGDISFLNSSCNANNVSMNGGCFRLYSTALLTLDNSDFSLNSAGYNESNCGGVISIQDPNASVNINGGTFEDNDVVYGGVICVNNVLKCRAPYAPPYIAFGPDPIKYRNPKVLAGELIYYHSDNVNTTQLPACIGNQSSLAFLPPTETNISIIASYPYRLLPVKSIYNIVTKASFVTSVNLFVEVVDFWNQSVPSLACQRHNLCIQAKNIAHSTLETASCLSSSIVTLPFHVAGGVGVGNYPVIIGNSDAVCGASTKPSASFLREHETTVTINVTEMTDATAPTSAPHLGPSTSLVVGLTIGAAGVVLIAAIWVIIVVYRHQKRTKRKEKDYDGYRLLASADLALGSTMTEMLSAAGIPVVDPEKILVQEQIGAGATGLVRFVLASLRIELMLDLSV